MDYLVFTYGGSSRDLKKIIVAILRSWFAENIKKLNYVHDYSMGTKNAEKQEEKIILIHTQNQDKLLEFLSKNFQQLKRINIK